MHLFTWPAGFFSNSLVTDFDTIHLFIFSLIHSCTIPVYLTWGIFRGCHMGGQTTSACLWSKDGPSLVWCVPHRTNIIVCISPEMENSRGLGTQERSVFGCTSSIIGHVEVILEMFRPQTLEELLTWKTVRDWPTVSWAGEAYLVLIANRTPRSSIIARLPEDIVIGKTPDGCIQGNFGFI